MGVFNSNIFVMGLKKPQKKDLLNQIEVFYSNDILLLIVFRANMLMSLEKSSY